MTSSFLPDVNVWVALCSDQHVHHHVASDWYDSIDEDARFYFCRFTQLGLLRLLTAEVVMREDVLSQTGAWRVYDGWIQGAGVELLDEPPGIDRPFRRLTQGRASSPKTWPDAYLAAFAEASDVTLVTFDRAFAGRVKPLILLAE
jgi:toxin-antitoxin system PIN domain toxin